MRCPYCGHEEVKADDWLNTQLIESASQAAQATARAEAARRDAIEECVRIAEWDNQQEGNECCELAVAQVVERLRALLSSPGAPQKGGK